MRRGFTLLELLLAMVIGSIVLAGGYALVGIVSRMDARFSDRLDTTMRLAFVQRTFARATHSIVAAPEGYDPLQAARLAVEEQEQAELYAELQDRDAFFEALSAENAEETPASREREARELEPAPARVRMGHLSKDQEWEYRGEDAALGVRRLELLLTRAPFGDQTRGAPVRGAFDLVPVDGAQGDRWRLQWTPIAPAGKPTVLLENLTLAEWMLTDSEGRFDDYASYVASDLPWALRTTLWTEDGQKVDWMFGFGAASTSGEPR